jgi:hypothetical protein
MKNNVAGQNSDGAHPDAPRRKPGRPRCWSDTKTRKQAYRIRQREWNELLEELYLALLNAHWEAPELQQAVLLPDDAEVVRGLIAYFRKRNWNGRRP